MELFDPKRLNFHWVKYFNPSLIFSSILCLVILVGLYKPGLNYGIDFKGGIEARVSFTDANVSQADLRAALENKLQNLSVVNFAEKGKSEFLITAQANDKENIANILTAALTEKYGAKDSAWTVSQLDVVGPKVGAELRKSALLALIYTSILISLYMYWRFDMRYSPGAVAAIVHDLLLTTGFLIVTRIEFSTTIVAALLTLAGYSINDTVVIFDRVRELEQKYPGRDKKAILNEAINSTLSRTIMTAGTTLVSCLVLFFIAGSEIRDFAATLFFGIIVGTYSSVFISAPVYYWADRLGKKRRNQSLGVQVG